MIIRYAPHAHRAVRQQKVERSRLRRDGRGNAQSRSYGCADRSRTPGPPAECQGLRLSVKGSTKNAELDNAKGSVKFRGAAQSCLFTTVPYMQAPDHYGFGKAGFPGQNGEGRSGLDVMFLRQALKGQVTRPPARMFVAAPERKRLNAKAQSERHSGDCKAMPHEVRHITVPVQQRQSAPTVLGVLRFRVCVRKGAVDWMSGSIDDLGKCRRLGRPPGCQTLRLSV